MKSKSKNYKFITQVTESSLKVIKYLEQDKEKKEIIGLELDHISPDANDTQVSEKLNSLFKKLKITKEPIIISLPRVLVTLRYLKVPSQDPKEIEKMVSLQASRYLPYPIEELTKGYSIVRKDQESYSYINLIIVHKDAINRLVYKILKDWTNQLEAIVLSSYGLFNWYKHIKFNKDLEPVMIIDVDTAYTEIAIVLKDKFLFSRAFKLPAEEKDFKIRLMDEINKTKESYGKEAISEEPKKIILTGCAKENLKEILKKEIALPIEFISGLKDIKEPNGSFTSLVGLSLEKIEDSLNLLPHAEKEKKRKLSQRKEWLNLGLLLLGTLIVFSLALSMRFYNKVTYLNKLKSELNRILPEAKAIDEMKKKSEVLKTQTLEGIKTVDVLYELYHLIPAELSLITLIYEQGNQVVLRGEAGDLSSIFKSISILEKSEIFKSAKVRYATRRKTPVGEVVDFEIVCPLKK